MSDYNQGVIDSLTVSYNRQRDFEKTIVLLEQRITALEKQLAKVLIKQKKNAN